MKKVLLRMAVAMLAIMVAISGLGIAVAQEGQDGAEVPVLAVDAPNVVQVDESVIITVTERSSGIAVEGASVYALSWPKPGLSDTNSIIAPQGYSCEFLGITTGGGNITHAFDRVGGLLIVATKEGYGPGLARLTVKPDLIGGLAIKADPRRADVGEEVTFTANTRGSETTVEGVALYALSRGSIGPIPMLLPQTDVQNLSFSETVVDSGEYLGATNEFGELKYQFSEAGIYLIAGIEDGYVPGITFVFVGQFHGLRQMLTQFGQFGECLGLEELSPQLNQLRERIHECLGLEELSPQLNQLRERIHEGLGLEELSPRLNQLRERFNEGLRQFGRGS